MPITNHMVGPDMKEPCSTLSPWRVHNKPNATNTMPTINLIQRSMHRSFRKAIRFGQAWLARLVEKPDELDALLYTARTRIGLRPRSS